MAVGCVGKIPIMYYAHKSVLWTSYAFLMPLVAFGLFGNILSFQVLGYNRSRRNQSSTFYLRALAIADSLTLVCNTLLMAQQMMLRPAMNLHPLNIISLVTGSFPMCNIRMYISQSTTLLSVYIIVLFSIERALVVINPFRWMRVFSLKKARGAVAALSITCCFVCVPAMFSFNKEHFLYPKRLYNITTGVTIEAPALLSMANCSRRTAVNNGTAARMNEPMTHLGIIAHMALIDEGLNWNDTEADANVTDANVTGADMLMTSIRRHWNRRGHMSGVGLKCQRIAECRINFPLFKRFILFHNISLSIVPFIITGICNLIILVSMRRRETKNMRTSKTNEDAQDRQVTRKLIIVSTAFIVLSFPLASFHIITLAMPGSYCSTFWANAMTITIALNSVNYAINFIIYCISEEQFRRLVVSCLLCQRHRLTRLLSYINEPKNRRGGPRDNQRSGGRGGGGGGATGEVTGGGTRRKDSNPRTNITTYSASQGCQSEASVTDVLVHEHHHQHQHHQVDEAEAVATAKKVEAAAAEYVLTLHQDEAAGQPHDFKNCSLLKDDWASELFADDDVGDARLRAVMARWSEVTPE